MLIFQFVQLFLVRMEWWLPNSLQARPEAGLLFLFIKWCLTDIFFLSSLEFSEKVHILVTVSIIIPFLIFSGSSSLFPKCFLAVHSAVLSFVDFLYFHSVFLGLLTTSTSCVCQLCQHLTGDVLLFLIFCLQILLGELNWLQVRGWLMASGQSLQRMLGYKMVVHS